jgi:LemA protein
MLLLAAIVLIIAAWIISSYNGLITKRSLAQEAWSGIDVQLKRRYDLIPNLLETVKGYSIHEKTIIQDIVTARAASMGATDVSQKEKAELSLNSSLKSLFALAENYPNLKANENFLELQRELSTIETELQLSRRYYNGAVRNYTIATTQFPTNLIANTFDFTPMAYFELTSAQERNNPSIKF